MLDMYFWSVVAFFSILGYLIYKDRENLEFDKIIVIKRTERGKDLLDKIANLNPRFWKTISTIGIIVAFGFMIAGTYMIIISSQLILDQSITKSPMQLIIPIPTSQPVNRSIFIGIPFWFWILVVPFVLFPHEFAHGVIARANDVKIKTVGLIQLLIWSGAFVEPDEKELEKSGYLKQLRIFSAGSITNISIAIIVMMLTQYLIWPFFVTDGIVIKDVFENSSAELYGLKPGTKIVKIDETDMDVGYQIFSAGYGHLLFQGGNTTAEYLEDFSAGVKLSHVLSEMEPNQTIKITTADGHIHNFKMGSRPDNSSLPYMGVSVTTEIKNKFMTEFMFPLLWWLSTISYFVAITNLLPVYPLDGGLMVKSIISEKFDDEKTDKIIKIVTSIMLILLIFNFIGPSIISRLVI